MRFLSDLWAKLNTSDKSFSESKEVSITRSEFTLDMEDDSYCMLVISALPHQSYDLDALFSGDNNTHYQNYPPTRLIATHSNDALKNLPTKDRRPNEAYLIFFGDHQESTIRDLAKQGRFNEAIAYAYDVTDTDQQRKIENPHYNERKSMSMDGH